MQLAPDVRESAHLRGVRIPKVNILRHRIQRVVVSYVLAMATWFGLACALAWQTTASATAVGRPTSFLSALLLPAVRFACYGLLTPPIFYIVRRYPIASGRVFQRIAAYAAGTGAFVIAFSFVRWIVLPPWDVVNNRWLERSFDGLVALIRGSFVDQVSMYIAIVAIAHSYEFFDRSRKQELETSNLQQALAASELQILKMQLHPHFLFNTLHGISVLIESDPTNAREMILKLSSLLRIALKHGSSDLIPLKDEMQFAQSYLELEQMRLGSRLQVRLAIAPETTPLFVPQLILQPLIENAIVHGIACCREGGWLEVESRNVNGRLELCVRNSVGCASQPGMGLGLVNTRARLRHLYGADAEFIFCLQAQTGAEALLRLPLLSGAPTTSLLDSTSTVG
jgi:two-component system LytT family sensor kinase